MLVEKAGNLFALERLTFHDMAPMAGGVADAQKNRLVFRPRPGKGLVAPGKPVDRIAGVLEQIGRFLAGQTVGALDDHSPKDRVRGRRRKMKSEANFASSARRGCTRLTTCYPPNPGVGKWSSGFARRNWSVCAWD